MITPAEVLMVLSILVSLTTLITFLKVKKKEAIEQGVRQANLDNAIQQVLKAVEQLTQGLAAQQKEINQLKLWLELLLQQHNTNHNQDIRRNQQ